jgi:hypothetical protein
MDDENPLIGRSVKMIARALIDDWDMPSGVRRASIARMAEVLKDKNAKRREVNAAVRALVAVERVRLDAMKIVGEQGQAMGLVDPEEARRAMREDPDYLDYLRQRAIDTDEGGACDGTN